MAQLASPANSDAAFERLLAELGGFQEKKLLEFLAATIPPNVAELLGRVGGIPLAHAADLSEKDILASLERHAFVAPSNRSLHWLVGELVFDCAFTSPDEVHPTLMMYLAVLYFYLDAVAPHWVHSELSAASCVLVRCGLALPLCDRLHLVKYLLHLFVGNKSLGSSYNSKVYHSFTLSLLLGGVFSDVSVLTEAHWKGLTENGRIQLLGEPIGWKSLVDQVVGEIGSVAIGCDCLQRMVDP